MSGEPKPDSETMRTIKENLNKEGWEGDEEGAAAVFVGTKEEAEQHRKRVETEGKSVDLRTHIHLNSWVVIPEDYEYSSEEDKAAVERMKPGDIYMEFGGLHARTILIYFSKNRDIKRVEIGPEFFVDKWGRGEERLAEDDLKSSLGELGFNIKGDGFDLATTVHSVKNERKKKAEQEKKDEFEF